MQYTFVHLFRIEIVTETLNLNKYERNNLKD